ncbi:DNA-directed RNA polymerase subunit beta [Desulfotalea psychrophila]|uniref:DNA-directed RNA polymerase subunit beta n=1 Tax=Desulfotalea psychrophila (strain LSv54 / DSM 12343) TaxID=177439 RepID=RPOB_DESPS|nr:DNA-directed RNA polymerase subunit beta [Desulfotalea psychrophila]Q6AP78.1 RecName: Full=DNA-directed RNA polymerase subunit beta; Short=RNAP subunit beta; AltName: Full=RNA polymerase subunit beta; AltName: Full=Transcriptase subunit beta [Desulfotalea psychrophila LSv54]CAG35846.1 probable DNA-directed RNA polymerase, beta-subunit [Desulfotalea psychrophila LSv54]
MERVRKNFATADNVLEPPHLISMQRISYEEFLQIDRAPEEREDVGLQAILKNIFPINDFNGLCSLEFLKYKFGEPKYTVQECQQRGMSYEIPLKIVVRLITFDVDEETGVQTIRDMKEQEVFLGSLPLMTADGVFVVNGTERVIVSQLQRSPGLFYSHDNGKSHSSGKLLYSARIIPVRGSWIDLEFDIKDVLHVRIDRRRKFPVTTLLKALGYSSEELLREFYPLENVKLSDGKYWVRFVAEHTAGQRLEFDLVNPQDGEILAKKGRKISKALCRKAVEAGIEFIEASSETILGKVLASAITLAGAEEPLYPCNTEITETVLENLAENGINEFETLFMDGVNYSASFSHTLRLDKVITTAEALLEIYRRLRPSSPPTLEIATTFFENLFFNPDLYDLSEVGRYKINAKLGLKTDIEHRALTRDDIIYGVRYLVRLKDNQGGIDDIDHLGNRRVRTVGELVENQYRMGLVRMERAIKERMTLQDVETLMPHDLINPKPISAAIKEFFGTSQLSQFMDQTNALSEVTHKRRLSALGPGGLSRERAGFEVRDVHPTHYGRICPIETPEGPNIGLIVSLATYARVNPYGFIETPYRKVENRVILDDIRYLSALEEQKQIIAPALVALEADHQSISEGNLIAREEGDVITIGSDNVTYMDVAPNQMISVAASLVPFLENDDANRALMGSNMQRQAVPLLVTAAPLVGTGMERYVARDSGACLLSAGDGVVEEVDSNRVVVRYDKPGVDGYDTGVAVYRLTKYKKSNQNTCFTQTPTILPGLKVEKGTLLADGPGCEAGELALGKNLTVAFMPWRGFNYEDSILINERLLKEDAYTSIHIDVFETMARDTKLGKEEITRDIPNVSEDTLRNLDDSGIVRVGAEIKPGDTLVGKVTPKGETVLSPEEKLLRAIFGEKAQDVKDSSLRVPPGVTGVVIDAKVFSRKGVDKDERSLMIEDLEIERLEGDKRDELRSLKNGVCRELGELIAGNTALGDILDSKGELLISSGDKIEVVHAIAIGFHRLKDIDFSGMADCTDRMDAAYERYQKQAEVIAQRYDGIIERQKKGDDLPPGVVKMVKVYVATKRKLSVGDKMAGRHGNKGVVSRILPEEDMPYFANGDTVDIVLNPLGVPSRMNVGQILEVHLGFAAKNLGAQLEKLAEQYAVEEIKAKLSRVYSDSEYHAIIDGKTDAEVIDWAYRHRKGLHMATPVFDGAEEAEIRKLLIESGVDKGGQSQLYDGLTGEPFANLVTVGVMYMLKLHHLVDNKIHARSTGPYSLVTQQPLGGKAQFGGQRLGEMEVWAMEAYGAAYTLKEFLTVKSDDVEGRTTMYERIVKGNNFLTTGLPESFHVLVKELQGLCLNMELIEE